MLRIGPSAPPPGKPQDAPPVDPMAGAAPPDPTSADPMGADPTVPKPKSPRASIQKVDQAVVIYMTSDQGPFECDHCEHFEGPSSCGIVKGTIDPQGCCNLYTPMGGTDEPENPDEAAQETPNDESAEAPPPASPQDDSQ